jgi:Mrp family chromosome partitioning ATPase/predicted Fe-Mo cluster-binding NifX family protein
MADDLLTDARALPANFGPLRGANGNARITGPCGDTMEFWLYAEQGRILRATFTTDGCGHSILCGAAAARLAEGKAVLYAAAVSQSDVLAAVPSVPEESRHCALLAFNTLKAAVADYRAIYERTQEADADSSGCDSCDNESCKAKDARPGERPEELEERRALRRRLCRIKHKVMVLSGKGGVGKSTVAVNLAVSLLLAGKRVGLLDVDIHGPSVPKMLGLEEAPVQTHASAIVPIELGDLKVMSIGFLLQKRDDAIIWRGPMKMGVIKQFLTEVEWGDLDYLIIDSPPGTGDEPLSVCQLIEDADGAVIVTTPQDVATADVRKSISFCRALHLPVLGVVENMSGFACPHCGRTTGIFKTGGGERMAKEMGVPFLGSIPIDAAVGNACDDGRPFVHHHARTETARAFEHVIKPILALGTPITAATAPEPPNLSKEKTMRIALPVAAGKLCMHFGHCETFALVDVNPESKTVIRTEAVDAPEHQPGLLPCWLAERGVHVVIAGGMGQRAQRLFAENRIKVVTGAPADIPEKVVVEYLAGILKTGANTCDH